VFRAILYIVSCWRSITSSSATDGAGSAEQQNGAANAPAWREWLDLIAGRERTGETDRTGADPRELRGPASG
jgi:hypothetical protein